MKILNKTKYLARVQIMSMFRMLDCGSNFKTGYRGVNCNSCNTTDDENHRINDCPKYKKRNLSNSSFSIDFESIYSKNDETVGRILYVISELWDLSSGKNTMKQ